MRITKNYLSISNTVLIDSGKEGPTVVIFSGIHGDEISGMNAVRMFFRNMEHEKSLIQNGKVILLFEGNEAAVHLSKRYVEHNLNRLFCEDMEGDSSYEHSRASELMKLLDEGDYLLDLHSTSGPSIPFLFSEKRNLDIAKKLGVPYIIAGWNDLGSLSVVGDTENYMNKKGGYGFTFESGNHDSPEGTDNAYQILLNFLSVLGVIDSILFKALPGEQNLIEMNYVHSCRTNDFRFALSDDALVNFTPIYAGTLIGMDGDEEIRAESDSIFIMPNLTKVKAGEDVFFIGRRL